MPVIRNRTRQEIALHRIGAVIGPGQELEVTAEQAAVLDGHPLLEPVPDDPKTKTSKKDGEDK